MFNIKNSFFNNQLSKETNLKEKQIRYVTRVHGKIILKGNSFLSFGILNNRN